MAAPSVIANVKARATRANVTPRLRNSAPELASATDAASTAGGGGRAPRARKQGGAPPDRKKHGERQQTEHLSLRRWRDRMCRRQVLPPARQVRDRRSPPARDKERARRLLRRRSGGG